MGVLGSVGCRDLDAQRETLQDVGEVLDTSRGPMAVEDVHYVSRSGIGHSFATHLERNVPGGLCNSP